MEYKLHQELNTRTMDSYVRLELNTRTMDSYVRLLLSNNYKPLSQTYR